MEQNNEFVTAVAKIKGCGMSARKMRLVADVVRSNDVESALATLRFTKERSSSLVREVINFCHCKLECTNWRRSG